MIIQWVRHRYRRSVRDYEAGGLIAVVVGVLSDPTPRAAGDVVTTANAYFRRTATMSGAVMARTRTTAAATFRRTVTTADGER